MTEGKKSEGNINDWARAIEGLSFNDLASKIETDRTEGFEALEKLGLPHYKKIIIDLTQFLESPESITQELGSRKFYAVLLDPNGKLQRFSKVGATLEEVQAWIDEKISPENQEHYQIILNQYYENLYGGNIVVNPSGQLLVEFKRGQVHGLPQGKITPEFYVTRDPHTQSLHYSFEDEQIRENIYRTLQTIPHSGEGRELTFKPGYYEFVLVKKTEESPPEPIFLDYNDLPSYHLPEQT